MKKPGNRYPAAPGSFHSMAPGILPDPTWNNTHFDEQIRNRGILFIHTKAIPCPNVMDTESMIHMDACNHSECWNGMLYIQPKEVWGFFNNDQLNKLFEVQGEYNENIAVITMSSTNEDGTECELGMFDRLVADEYSKRMYELVEHNVIGVDRLQYQAVDVFALRTGDREFQKDIDFKITDGKIEWISKNRPTYNQQLKRGEVYSIGYYIKLTFLVHHIMKEVRASQVLDSTTNEKVAVRFPQHIVVSRQLQEPDSDGKKGKIPRTGLFPPR